MTDFLVLFKTGSGAADYEVCAVIQGKKAEEAEAAVREGLTRGPGEYLAVPLTKAVPLMATSSYDLTPPNEVEAAPEPG